MATTLDDDRRALSEAEQRLFAALDLEHRSERLSLTDALGHARVVETGEKPCRSCSPGGLRIPTTRRTTTSAKILDLVSYDPGAGRTTAPLGRCHPGE